MDRVPGLARTSIADPPPPRPRANPAMQQSSSSSSPVLDTSPAPDASPALPALLYTSPAADIVLLDIPAALSAPPGQVPRCVHQPPATPYTVTEPKAQTAFTRDLARAHDCLRAPLLEALEHIRQHHGGPACHPRAPPDEAAASPGQELDFHAHVPLLQLPDSAQEPLTLDHDTAFSDISDILSVPFISSASAWTALTLSHPHPPKTFHIPPRSSFLLSPFQSSIATFTALAEQLQRFHFILVDPPWPNRSVTRSHTYSTLSRFAMNDLLSLPIAGALAHDGIVAIWITNKPKYHTYVLNTLFPRWGVVPAGEWIWLKTTTAGEPVFDLECSTRKPYEVLLFARRPFSEAVLVPVPVLAKTILAVPNLHSQKPCVKGFNSPWCGRLG